MRQSGSGGASNSGILSLGKNFNCIVYDAGSNMIRTAILSAALGYGTAATPVLLGRGDSLEEWASQGSQTSLATSSQNATPWSGLPFLNFSYGFSTGGWQTAFGPADASASVKQVPFQLNLSFAAFLPAGSPSSCITIGVTDSAGSSFGNCIGLSHGWQNISLALATASFWSNGRNMSLPIQGLSLGVSNPKAPGPGPSGWLGIADVALLSDALPGAIPNPVFHLLVQASWHSHAA